MADKTYDDEGEASVVAGQAHLGVSGGGPNTTQVFALPPFNAQLNTLEVAFDYHTNMVSDDYGRLEVGYMTNPSKASTFVSLKTLEQTLTDKHAIVTLEDLPANAQFIAFRFAGGTSDFGSLSMDNFVVAEIGHSQEVDPSQEVTPDAGIYGLTYCEAQFVWYSYNSEAFAIGLFEVASEQLISGIVVTTGECDRFANQDGVGFSEYDDYENKYYCSTKWLLNAEEGSFAKGDAWNSCVINEGTATVPVLGLKPGVYQVQIHAYDPNTGTKGALIATIQFEIVAKNITNLLAVVADDLATATLIWSEPELAYGERLYMSVRSGDIVAFDNFDDAHLVATSPMTIDVIEGRTYTASIQIIDRNKNPLGSEIACDFTVGVNKYEPQNPTAIVTDGENVTFSWETIEEADRYLIVLYLNGEFYGTLTATGTSHTSFIPEEGEWSWTIQAYNQGENGNYFPVSGTIEGNNFFGETPEIPEEGIEVYPWEMIAAYYPTAPGDEDYREGKYIWFVSLYCGANGSAYPTANYILYSDKEYGISGVYSKELNNIYMGEGFTMMEVIDGSANAKRLTATDTELHLVFERYDEEEFDDTHRYGRYSGRFSMTVEDGTVYYGSFQDIYCKSFNAGYLFETEAYEHVGMWDEENSQEGIENIVIPETEGVQKIMHEGQLFIIREGRIYNAQGAVVK